MRLELGGRALFGPVGATAARAVKGDMEKSLDAVRRALRLAARLDAPMSEAPTGQATVPVP